MTGKNEFIDQEKGGTLTSDLYSFVSPQSAQSVTVAGFLTTIESTSPSLLCDVPPMFMIFFHSHRRTFLKLAAIHEKTSCYLVEILVLEDIMQ